jgi:hypothetical protein
MLAIIAVFGFLPGPGLVWADMMPTSPETEQVPADVDEVLIENLSSQGADVEEIGEIVSGLTHSEANHFASHPDQLQIVGTPNYTMFILALVVGIYAIGAGAVYYP